MNSSTPSADVAEALASLKLSIDHWRGALDLAAEITKKSNLSRYQRAISEQLPSCGNLIHGIECLLQNRYLFAAKVLTRPLLERTANLSFFRAKQEDALILWENGWNIQARPSLKKRMACLPDDIFPRNADGSFGKSTPIPHVKAELFRRVEKLHGVVHGDLDSLGETLTTQLGGLDYHTIGVDYQNEWLLQDIAHLTIVLTMFGVFEIESAFVQTAELVEQ
jgi:hypothetical protein